MEQYQIRIRIEKQRTFSHEKKSTDQKKFVQASEYTTRLRERNRLASRIHDKIGHGITGNILLLEGAAMMIDKDPYKSKETIRKVASNLREDVDDIRASLREEHSSVSKVGLSEIKTELSRLSSEHRNISTEVVTKGDMDNINYAIWFCIHENLKEAVSNVLGHSDATKFEILITNKDKLTRAVIKDNGEVSDFKTDIGLQSMEERCAEIGGRCFFSVEGGFKIVMTFNDSEEYI